MGLQSFPKSISINIVYNTIHTHSTVLTVLKADEIHAELLMHMHLLQPLVHHLLSRGPTYTVNDNITVFYPVGLAGKMAVDASLRMGTTMREEGILVQVSLSDLIVPLRPTSC